MSDNVMESLRCPMPLHGLMERRVADRQPHAGPFSVWVCLTCGVLALHLEWCGDIHWYPAIPEAWPHGLNGNDSHLATCDYCPERFNCGCGKPDGPHMCDRCNAAAEESKREVTPLHYNREGYLASGKIDDETSRLPRQFLPLDDPGEQADEAAALEGDGLPW